MAIVIVAQLAADDARVGLRLALQGGDRLLRFDVPAGWQKALQGLAHQARG
jgi:hypothetical protein